MSSEWRSVQLGDIAQFKAGSAFKLEFQGISSGELPFIKVSDLNLPGNEHAIRTANNWISRELAKEIKAAIHPLGATVFAKIGVALTYNRRRVLLQECAIDNNMMSAIPDESAVRPRYLYFLLKSLDFNEIAQGSALPYLNARDLKSIEVRLPNLGHQDAVVDILGSIEDRIDGLSETNATLEAIAQALFKSWFVDFDPVHAKAEGREPEGMDPATAALFPSEFEDSELGPIPKGWEVEPFGSAFNFTMGQSPPGSTYNTDGAGTTLFQGCTDFADVFPTERVFTTAPIRLAEAGDVLMSVRAPVGAVNLAASICAIGRGLCAIRHKSGSTGLTIEFVKASVQRIESAAGEGALFKSLSKRQLADLPVISPGEAILTTAIELLNPIVKRRFLLAQQAEALTQLRNILLPRLISGKLRLSKTEDVVEELSM